MTIILSGADLKDAKEMIGHKNISMTDRYSHLTTAYKLQKQELLADFYMNGMQSENNCVEVIKPKNGLLEAKTDKLDRSQPAYIIKYFELIVLSTS